LRRTTIAGVSAPTEGWGLAAGGLVVDWVVVPVVVVLGVELVAEPVDCPGGACEVVSPLVVVVVVVVVGGGLVVVVDSVVVVVGVVGVVPVALGVSASAPLAPDASGPAVRPLPISSVSAARQDERRALTPR
jgi:hypothetical protein